MKTNEWTEAHRAIKQWCERMEREGWPSDAVKHHGTRVRLYLWECSHNHPPHHSARSAMKVRFRSTDGLRKYARDLPHGRASRKAYDPKEHDDLIASRERLTAEIKARRASTGAGTTGQTEEGK